MRWFRPLSLLSGAPIWKGTLQSIILIIIKNLSFREPSSKIQVKSWFPPPYIEDILDHLVHAHYFTKLYLQASYHQVHMATSDTWKTTFKMKFHIFEWMVMPSSLTNALKTFMCLINDIFHLCLGHSIIIYIDDILILRKT